MGVEEEQLRILNKAVVKYLKVQHRHSLGKTEKHYYKPQVSRQAEIRDSHRDYRYTSLLGKIYPAPYHPPKLDDHPMSAVRDCLFSIFTSAGRLLLPKS
jgi:hypothetical protein